MREFKMNILPIVDMFFLNPARASIQILYLSAHSFKRLFNIRVNSLPNVLNKVMPR